MKVQILQEDLAKGLAIVARVVASKGQLPVLANVLVEGKREGLSLAATNLEIGLRVEVGGKVTEEGVVTVPARQMSEFVGSLSAGSVSLMAEGDRLKLEAGSGKASLVGIAASEFPPFAKATEGQALKIKKGMIEEVAREVAFAAAGDESRPVLTGVQFTVHSSQLIVAATDGFRMSKKIISNVDDSMFNNLILPARTILELARIAGESGNSEVQMQVLAESNQVLFKIGKVELVSRMLEGSFPDVEKIIPKEHKVEVVIDREELLRSVRSASIFARENSNIVKLNIKDQIVKISAQAGSVGENVSEIEAEVKGESNSEIAFNFKYILDFLGSVEGERVTLKINESLTPGVWGVEGEENLVHLIMPVRV